MMHSFTRTARLALVCIAFAGCVTTRGAAGTPAAVNARNDWPAVLAQASQEAQAGRYGVADRLLADFATKYAGTEPAAEAQFWRALYRVDPANQTASPKEAIAMLDSYLASPLSAPRRSEALVLRRVAAALDARPAVVTVTTPASGGAGKSDSAAKADNSAKDDEIAKLKDELSKANAELERIKRRLAAPKP
jgi:hypothetical protein